MKHRRVFRALCWLGALLSLAFLVTSVDARGRGGGGRGGGGRGGGFSRGGSMSRSSAASRGSFRTRPSTRPSVGTRPAQPGSVGTRPAQPSTQPARPANRPADRPGGGNRPDRPGGGEDRPDRDDAREDWQQHREDMQQQRQNYANQAREDWQEYAEWDESGGYWIGGWYGPVVYHHDVDDWVVFVSGLAIGTALTSAAYHSMQAETKCTPTEVTVNQITYLKCGDQWYNRVMQGGQVNYVVVAAPPGF